MSAVAVAERPRRTVASAALARIPPGICPTCGRPTRVEVVTTDALFRHAGHGATHKVTTRFCVCGWALVTEVTEVRPGIGP